MSLRLFSHPHSFITKFHLLTEFRLSYDIIQILTSVLQKIKYEAETLCAHIIWVWYIGHLSHLKELRHTADLMSSLNRWGKVHEILIVLVIHGYDHVEVQHVHGPHLTCDVGNGEASVKGRCTHASVRLVAAVAAIDASRISLHPVLKSVFTHIMFEYRLSRRRTADVSQADKKDLVFIADGFHLLYDYALDSSWY